MILGKDELAKTHAEIIDKYPESAYSANSYIYLFMAPDNAFKNITQDQLKEYIKHLPDAKKYYIWHSALYAMQKKNVTPRKILEFFTPILDNPPEYQDYQPLFLDLAELAFQSGLNDYENKAIKCESFVAGKPFLNSDTTQKKQEKKK